MSEDLFDQIMNIAMPICNKGSEARKAELIEALSCALGRSIGRISKGDRKAIDTFLTGSENYVACEAAYAADLVKSIHHIVGQGINKPK